jgi:hypothetical protein
MTEDQELQQRAAAWGMTPQALANLLKCGKGGKYSLSPSDPDNHHLRFEADKIFLRVRINRQRIEERLSSDIILARQERDKRLAALGFNHQLFIRNQEAYNARKNRQA